MSDDGDFGDTVILPFRAPGRVPNDESEEIITPGLEQIDEATRAVETLDGGWIIDVRYLAYDVKILQGRHWLAQGRLGDARVVFESAHRDPSDIADVYLRVIDLFEIPDDDRVGYLRLFKVFAQDLITNIECTYLRNYESVDYPDLSRHFQIISQNGFNLGHLDGDLHGDRQYALTQRLDALVLDSDLCFAEIEVHAQAMIADLRAMAALEPAD